MCKKVLVLSAWVTLACLATTSHALVKTDDKFKYPFYVGLTGGYGWTTWGGLVPSEKNQSFAISLSTPLSTHEDGALWGAFAGYEIIPYFALEAAYMRYPNATVTFDPSSLFTFDHDGITEFTSKTETISLMGKIMLII